MKKESVYFNGMCQMCFNAYNWRCPLLKYLPKNIRSCTAFESTEQCDMIISFIEELDRCIKSNSIVGRIILLKEKYITKIKECHIDYVCSKR